MRRKSSLSRYLLDWKLLPNPGNTAEDIGVLFPTTNPQFPRKSFVFGELLDAEFPNWEGPLGDPIDVLWGILPANSGPVEFPVNWSRSCPRHTWGTLGCVTVIYQGWSRSRCLCSPDMANPQSHTCFWEGQTLGRSEITRGHHIISCAAAAENVGSNLKWEMSEEIKSRFYFCGSCALLSCQPWHLGHVLLRSYHTTHANPLCLQQIRHCISKSHPKLF